MTKQESIKKAYGDYYEKCNPMNEFPEQVEGEHFSRTVLVYDTDLEDFDLGFYNYDTQKWDVMGGFQMELICWSYIPAPLTKDYLLNLVNITQTVV